jgi:methylmalonyl-CoA mutase cobalamin-binding subunit
LLTERSNAIFISVTKGWHMSRPADLVQELEKEAADRNGLSAAISGVVKLKEA